MSERAPLPERGPGNARRHPTADTWVRDRFSELVRRDDASIPLAEACLLIAEAANPGLVDQTGVIAELDALAERVRARLPEEAEATDDAIPTLSPGDVELALDALHDVLYVDLGLRAAPRSLLDPRSSYLDEVLAGRTGLPILLGIVELEIAWRLGLPLHGIGLPGHFIVGGPGGLLLDPCAGGRRLTPDDCQALIRQSTGRPVLLRPYMLQPATRREILARVLGNLRGIFLARREWSGALWTLELLVVLEPRDPGLRRDRALLYGRVGRFSEAVRGLERYLEEQPDATDRDEVAVAKGIFAGRRN